MSLKSGMKFEVTNALNTLSTLTRQDSDNLQIMHCPELLDVLLDLMEATSSKWRFDGYIHKADFNDICEDELADSEHQLHTQQVGIFCQRSQFDTYQKLFEASVDEACHLMEYKSYSEHKHRDQLDSASVSTSASTLDFREWSFNKDQFLSLSNILRNLSFLPANYEFLARHPRFLEVLKRTLLAPQTKVFGSIDDIEDQGKIASSDQKSDDMETDSVEYQRAQAQKMKTEWLPSSGALAILEHRKDVLTILANLSGYLILPDSNAAQWIMLLILDFMNAEDTYYASLALEAVAKLGISHDNRLLLSSVDRDLRKETLKQRHGGRLPPRALAHHKTTPTSSSALHVFTDDAMEKWEEGGYLLPLFQSLSAMLGKVLTIVTEQQRALVMPHSTLAHLETLMLATYNLAALSEVDFRRYMAVQPGFVAGLLKLSVALADVRTPAYTSASMRTVETLRVISKDNEHLLVQYTELIAKAAMQPHIHPKILDDLMCVL
ncbi:hypothetical protein BCR41DRAFT_174415 [Lobosporangium transversale]|uniref:SWI/SNF-like complex subunit BAF250 C-terminal domain-containing protein n=1 Tax=Lobosporangium transversale TaxID=64571 RepID=A0A1Y2GCT2_9FUNG|nr:hypothetical protein BCR41DRAFT_174415 [Lobosporangium transversale]ORZ05949.1 hypothetical protein BCR41DRAFT_174415 [Lobosporangium transversale]|eukprot:XP_021877330.1 hypothetical protein BCR41DRAFT_174415 [Lobosporangium transversale]